MNDGEKGALEEIGGPTDLFEGYRSQCTQEVRRLTLAQKKLLQTYAQLASRWRPLADLKSFEDKENGTQRVGSEISSVPPANLESAIMGCFEEVYSRSSKVNAAYHKRMRSLVARFKAARTARDIGLDQLVYPLLLHRSTTTKMTRSDDESDYVPGALKNKQRARDEFLEWPDGLTQWPPAPLEMTDFVTGTVVFDDPYEIVTFLAYLQMHFKVVRIENRFEGLELIEDEEPQPAFRNVFCKLLFIKEGLVVVTELQLHFRLLHESAKEMREIYEVMHAASPDELLHQPPKWQSYLDFGSLSRSGM